MRESLNLATADGRIRNGRGAPGLGGRLIGDRALLSGRRVRPDEGDEVGAFIHRESVRIDYCIANAVGRDIRVAILEADDFPAHRNGRKMITGDQKLSVRGQRSMAKIGTECGHFRRPHVVGQASVVRHGEGSDDPDEAGQHHRFDESETVTSG